MSKERRMQKEGSVHKNYRLPADLVRWIDEQAAIEDVSATRVVVYYLEEARKKQQRHNKRKRG